MTRTVLADQARDLGSRRRSSPFSSIRSKAYRNTLSLARGDKRDRTRRRRCHRRRQLRHRRCKSASVAGPASRRSAGSDGWDHCQDGYRASPARRFCGRWCGSHRAWSRAAIGRRRVAYRFWLGGTAEWTRPARYAATCEPNKARQRWLQLPTGQSPALLGVFVIFFAADERL